MMLQEIFASPLSAIASGLSEFGVHFGLRKANAKCKTRYRDIGQINAQERETVGMSHFSATSIVIGQMTFDRPRALLFLLISSDRSAMRERHQISMLGGQCTFAVASGQVHFMFLCTEHNRLTLMSEKGERGDMVCAWVSVRLYTHTLDRQNTYRPKKPSYCGESFD